MVSVPIFELKDVHTTNMSFITDSDNILIFLNLLLFRFTLGNTGLRPAAHDRRIQSVSEPGKKNLIPYICGIIHVGCPRSGHCTIGDRGT